MGLDMYLNKIKMDGSGNTHSTEIKYWRKCNQIHDWFLRHGNLDYSFNAGNEPLYVDKEMAKQFLNELKIAIEDHEKAKELFPTADGFFWGSPEYDEWYYKDLQKTRADLVGAYLDTDWDNEHWEYSCWW